MTTATLYTTKQVADALEISTGRVRQLAIALGVGCKWGRDWMFDEADVEALRHRKSQPGPKPKRQ